MQNAILQYKFNSDPCEVYYLKVKTLMGKTGDPET